MSERRLRIRTFRLEDFEAIYRIDQICFPPEIAFSRGEFLFYLGHRKRIAYLAEGSDGIAGFVLAQIDNASIAHVVTLDVVPEMRRCSVGTRLMNQMHDELQKRGVKAAILEVGVQNTAARRLYEKLGYESECLLPGYYGGKEDACRMRREVGVGC
jgi:ribosomal-protein-alanine N-acetyltransferase